MVPSTSTAKATRPLPPATPMVSPESTQANEASPAAPFSVTTVHHGDYQDVFARVRDGYALPEVDDPAIDRLERFYASKPAFLDRTFERGERYLYYVVQELDARHMPLELALLPVIESAYNPYAYSRARAAGVWQFITPTATRHQVRVNWWQDGRRDIMDSTRAALDYLEELHTMFGGDWLLAVAAYNCGENAVARAVQRNAAAGLPTDFWHLGLPKETRGYVPSLLAMARIVKNPEAHGLDFASIPNRPYFARVEVGGQIDLRVAAAILNVSDEEMHALNPAFNRWATDPDGPFHVLVPAASALSFAEIVAGLTPEQRLPVEKHTLEAKESVASLAKARNLPLAVVEQLNGNAHFTAKVGDEILLPSTLVVAPLKAGLVIEGETPGTLRPLHRTAMVQRHIVRHGETLASIARDNHVDLATLAHQNGLKPQATLKAGRHLLVKGAGKADETNPTASATPAPTGKAAPAAAAAASPVTKTAMTQNHGAQSSPVPVREIRYQVKHGDTLNALTRKFSVSVAQLKSWNRLGKTLTPGEMIVVHVPADRDFGG
jgi:membrane-bound lytic murein transglycosylase D